MAKLEKNLNDDLLDAPHHIQENDKIKIQSELKEEIITGKDTEEEDDELSKMLNDIKIAIM
ncbi:hypothetical protein [Clostridium sp.]|uniref:hypothetical protein n=1 Tax=Clostridium sp. TaxID=1506 RepID=UPI001A4C80E7|nr:hypothetical protein [Clostridium sp.]MBK5242520.1 hypothetical protein [Clostridium sp.]